MDTAAETTVAETVADTEESGETAVEVTEETSGGACDPNPCVGRDARCVDGELVTYQSPGTCSESAGLTSCEYASTRTSCGADQVCAGDRCVAAGDACEYTASEHVSFLSELRIGNQVPEETCCFDYNGDNTPDNEFGELMKTAATILGREINDDIEALIRDGTIMIVMEMAGVDDLVDDSDMAVYGFYAEDEDGQLSNNAAGQGRFSVEARSFHPGTAVPVSDLGDARIANGRLAAGPGTLGLSIPTLGAQLDVRVSLAEIEGRVTVGPNETGLALGADSELGARLGGAIKMSDLYGALNDFFIECGCLEYTDPTDTVLINEDGTCNAVTTDRCSPELASACADFPGRCTILLNFIQPDIDTSCFASGRYIAADCSGTLDAISIGAWFRATSARVTGVTGCETP